MKYFVRAHRSTGMAYVHSKGGKVFTSKDRSDATIFSSKARAKAVADKLNKTAADISANVEAVYWDEAKKNPSHIRALPRNASAKDYSERVKLRGYNGPQGQPRLKRLLQGRAGARIRRHAKP